MYAHRCIETRPHSNVPGQVLGDAAKPSMTVDVPRVYCSLGIGAPSSDV
jgi:hypothetical protein